MLRLRPLVACVVAALGASGAASTARAQEPPAAGEVSDRGDDQIDDPKVERRLGTRVALGASPPGVPAVASADVSAATLEGAPSAEGGEVGDSDVVLTEASPPAPERPRHVPRVKIAYRLFQFAQVGATAMSGAGAAETFHVVSFDFYPISSTFRFGLSSQYGWEDGTFRNNGDAFLAQSLSAGGQVPGDVFTPFFDVHAGGGLMQRTHAMLNGIGTIYLQGGLDVGTEIFLSRHAFFSLSVGYLHGYNAFLKTQKFGTFGVDTWAVKLGFGI
jgi:hypothetical protein